MPQVCTNVDRDVLLGVSSKFYAVFDPVALLFIHPRASCRSEVRLRERRREIWRCKRVQSRSMSVLIDKLAANTEVGILDFLDFLFLLSCLLMYMRFRSCFNRTRSLETFRTLSVPATILDKSHSIYHSTSDRLAWFVGSRRWWGGSARSGCRSGSPDYGMWKYVKIRIQTPWCLNHSESLCGQISLPSSPLRNASGSSWSCGTCVASSVQVRGRARTCLSHSMQPQFQLRQVNTANTMYSVWSTFCMADLCASKFDQMSCPRWMGPHVLQANCLSLQFMMVALQYVWAKESLWFGSFHVQLPWCQQKRVWWKSSFINPCLSIWDWRLKHFFWGQRIHPSQVPAGITGESWSTRSRSLLLDDKASQGWKCLLR